MLQMPGTIDLGIGEHGDRRSIAVPVPSIKEKHREGLAFKVFPQDRRDLSTHELCVVLPFDFGRTAHDGRANPTWESSRP